MNHLFIPIELALIAKNKGYDEPSLAYYISHDDGEKSLIISYLPEQGYGDKIIQAPLYQQIIEWLREKHGLSVWAFELKLKDCGYVVYERKTGRLRDHNAGKIKTFQEAQEKAILDALNLI